MSDEMVSRRDFARLAALGAAALSVGTWPRRAAARGVPADLPADFCIRPEELTLRVQEAPGRRALAFSKFAGTPAEWRQAAREKLAELLGFRPPAPCTARRLRAVTHEEVTIEAWVLEVSAALTLPGYLLRPARGAARRSAVLALHGHGQCEPCLGAYDDYHHAFALRLAQAGHVVLCPELRGFGALSDMCHSDDGHWRDYWDSRRSRQFTLVTDGFLYGRTLIGDTVADLLRWEAWLAEAHAVDKLDVAGISYGGDLALTYPAFSTRAERVYASGSFGAFSAVFARCYNAPAHCIPGVLQWLDRSDIAGLLAPRPIRLHYGELDRPGPDNASAAYNETVEPALAELRAIYCASEAPEQVSLRVTPGQGHEFEIDDLLRFVARAEPPRA